MALGAHIAAGATKGLAELPAYMERQEEARKRKELANMQLEEYKNQAPLRESETELALAQNQAELKQTHANMLRDSTYKAFDRFSADKDVRHLNTFLKEAKQNPIGANMYGQIASISPLTRSTETDKMLRSAGYNDLDSVYAKDDSLVIAIDNAGGQSIVDMNKLYGATGYASHMTNQQLEQLERQAKIDNLLRQGQRLSDIEQADKLVSSIMESDPNLSYHDAYNRAVEIMKGGTSGSSDLRAIQKIAEEEGITTMQAAEKYYGAKKGEGYKTNEREYVDQYIADNPGATYTQAVEAYKNLNKTSTQKEIGDAESIRAALDESDFFNTDFKTLSPAERARTSAHIRNLEELTNAQLSTEDKRVLRDMRKIVDLSQVVNGDINDPGLTEASTGLVDTWFNGVKSYVSNEIGTKEATASYETIRNILRNSLFGASLTEGERQAFDKAAGTLKQQLGPVLAKFKAQMMTVKSSLEAIRDTNDPYVAHYYVGGDVEDIDEVIRHIDERIAFMEDRSKRVGGIEMQAITAEPVTKPTPELSLDDIFGEL